MTISVKLEGFEKCEQHLAQIPIELRGQAVKAGLRDAARIVVMVAKALCPPRDYRDRDAQGRPLKQRITYQIKELKQSGNLAVIIGPEKETIPSRQRHGHLVEEGHRLVKGGTVGHVRGWSAGITARGRRQLEQAGYHQTGLYAQHWANAAGITIHPGIEVRGGGRVIGWVKGSPFLSPAAVNTRTQQAQALATGLIQAVNKALAS